LLFSGNNTYLCTTVNQRQQILDKAMRRIAYFILAIVLFGSCSRGDQMRLQLERLEQDNRNDSVMRNDSLAESLTDYFDAHGSANEQMRAYYILGRTYFDLGELPRALETYYKAADCADTTSADCDYRTLSRVHAQAAEVFHRQIQLRSELEELKIAGNYASKAGDLLMDVECYTKQAPAYRILHKSDSVLLIIESASERFRELKHIERSAQVLGGAVSSLVELGNVSKAKRYLDIYEHSSGLFDDAGNIKKGREIYYYAKGEYYMAVNKLDSAESLFRRLLADTLDLNCKIAGSKGLQQVFSNKGIPDSIVKYSNRAYEFNDSAYSLSEMQEIQKFQASYNYNHNRLLAEQQKRKAYRAYLLIAVILALVVISSGISFYLFSEHRKREKEKENQFRRDIQELERMQTELMQLRSIERHEAEMLIESKNNDLRALQEKVASQQELLEARSASLETKLDSSEMVKHLRHLIEQNPPTEASQTDFRNLRQFFIETIPSFYSTLNTSKYSLRPIEYDVCMLIRLHFQPAEICKLTGRSDSYISNLRKHILVKVFGLKGAPKDLDQRILQIK